MDPHNPQLVTYSVVVPLKDEEANVGPLVKEIASVMEGMKAPWELILIDDGSTDATQALIRRLMKSHSFLRLIVFDRNYGQSSAFDAGFRAAKGIYVITLDGDLQNDPKDIPKMVEKMKDYDLICGWRAKRNDSLFKRLLSRMANAIRSRLCKDGMNDTGCSLKIYRRECLGKIKLYTGMHRFLPALFSIEGFRTGQIEVNHRKRTEGKSKYNFFSRGLKTVSDLFAVVWMRRRHLHYIIKGELRPSQEERTCKEQADSLSSPYVKKPPKAAPSIK